MIAYFVHDDLRHTVCVYYNLDEAECNIHQWCRVREVVTRPTVLEAYQASTEKLCDLYRKLAS